MDNSNASLLQPLVVQQQQNTPVEQTWEHIQYDMNKVHPSPRSGVGEAYYNRLMYIFGGYHQGQALNDLWTFDLDTLLWTQIHYIGDTPPPRTSHSMCIDSDNAKLYVLCGSGSLFGSSNLGDVYEFDLLLHTWKKLEFKGDTLYPRYGQTAVLCKNKIFIFGGTYGREFCGDFLVLDLTTMTCSQLPLKGEFASPRYKHAAVFLSPNKMILHGGATTQNYRLDDTYLVDLDSLIWTRLETSGETPNGQFAHTLCVSPVTKSVWLFGGCDRIRCMADLYKLEYSCRQNQKTWIWKKVKADNIPPPRYFHSCIFDDIKGAIIIWAGKGAISEQIRFQDLHRMSVDNGERKRIKICMPQCTFTNDLLNYLISDHGEEESDMKIVSNPGDSIAVHKPVLLARCQRLLDLCDNYGCISLPLSTSSIVVLVYFLYSGEVSFKIAELEDPAMVCSELLQFSYMMGIEALVDICQKFLFRMMSEQTAIVCFNLTQGTNVFSTYIASYLEIRRGNDSSFSSRSRVVQTLNSTVPNTVKNDFLHLFEQSEGTDFSFKVGSDVLQCHSFILASRTTYFRSLSLRKFMAESLEKSCTFELPINFLQDTAEGDTQTKVARLCEFIMRYIYAGEASLDGSIDAEFAKIFVRLDLGNYFGFSNNHLQNFCMTQLSLEDRVSKIPQQKSEVPMLTMPSMLWSSFSGMNHFRVK